MTAVENSLSSCTFSDALYVTADNDEISSKDTSSEYFSVATHADSSLSTTADDSGMCRTPPGCFLGSTIDTNLLEETLEDDEQLANYVQEQAGQKIDGSRTAEYDDRSETLSQNSFIVVSASHERHKSNSSVLSGSSSRVSRCSDSLSAFTLDGSISGDDMFDQPSMEYEDAWTPCAQSSPAKEQKREKIYIRELSFDELQDLKGVDLMAPVFLAVTNEADDNVCDLQRKCKSIEDLCSTINYPDHDDSVLRKRSKSALSVRPKKLKKPSPLTMEENHDGEWELNSSLEEVKHRLASLSTSMKSHLSYEDVRFPVSPGSSVYNTSAEFEIPNSADYLPSPGKFSFSDPDDEQQIDGEKIPEMKLKFQLDTADLMRSPQRVEGSSCGFWEYPYGSPASPPPNITTKKAEFVRSPSLNTSPTSQSSSTPHTSSDRFVVVNVAGQQRIVDMKLIEDYLKILTHGGHHTVGKERRTIVVFNAYYLPKRNVPKYDIVMEQLFYYCAHAVDLLVMEAYEIVFFNSAMDGTNMPSRQLIKMCYEMIQYRLKKNLQNIYFVHPSLLLKTVLRFTHFFVSSKFRRKVHFVKNIKALKSHLPLEYIFVSPEIHQLEKKKFS